MNLSYFQLQERPFTTMPLADHCCHFPTFRENLLAVENALRQQQGPALIVGGPGTGKTMLLRVLAQQLSQSSGICLTLDAAFADRHEFYGSLLFELGLSQEAAMGGDPRLLLTSAVRARPEFAAGVWLLLDEAHSLDRDLFEQLRLLSNLVRDGRSVFQLAFAGTRALEEQLLTPELESLQQRIACRVYLTGMSLAELGVYIDFLWRRAGGRRSPFTAEAVQAIHTATMGIPRLVNQIGEHALAHAIAQRLEVIDERAIQVAWAMWQRLPVPQLPEKLVSGSLPANERKPNVVEFGSLDDEATPTSTDASGTDSKHSRPLLTIGKGVEDPGVGLVSEAMGSVDLAIPQAEPAKTLIRFAFEADIQKPPPQPSATAAKAPTSPDASFPTVPMSQSWRHWEQTLDTVQQALISLQEPWQPIDEMLIEADLEAITSPVEVINQSAEVTRQVISHEPSVVFQDHLYLESLWMEDTVWTQYIRTPDSLDEVSPVSLPLPGLLNQAPHAQPLVEPTRPEIPARDVPSVEIRIDENAHRKVNPPQGLARWESVRSLDSPTVAWNGSEPELGPAARTSGNSFHDDANIILRQPAEVVQAVAREPHPPQPLSPPVLARRKDLRALLHALRGY